jgi:hypothetical protein
MRTQPTRDRQDDRVGREIAGEHPFTVVDRRREAACDPLRDGVRRRQRRETIPRNTGVARGQNACATQEGSGPLRLPIGEFPHVRSRSFAKQPDVDAAAI